MSFDFTTLVTDRTQSDVQRVRDMAARIINGTASEAEIAEWNAATMRGAYNYTDLNRVTAAIEALKAALEGYGYSVPGYKRIEIPRSDGDNAVTLTNLIRDSSFETGSWSGATNFELPPRYEWCEDDIPTPEQMTNYLQNVSVIRSSLATMPSTPGVPSDMELLSFSKANAIEQILMDVHTLIQNMIAAWFYCGEVYSGEV